MRKDAWLQTLLPREMAKGNPERLRLDSATQLLGECAQMIEEYHELFVEPEWAFAGSRRAYNKALAGPRRAHNKALADPRRAHNKALAGPRRAHNKTFAGPRRAHNKALAGPRRAHNRAPTGPRTHNKALTAPPCFKGQENPAALAILLDLLTERRAASAVTSGRPWDIFQHSHALVTNRLENKDMCRPSLCDMNAVKTPMMRPIKVVMQAQETKPTMFSDPVLATID
ncbi:hypothetical protein BDQ12DRAFT_726029 [Crucibulum laeve]|uniref:Uncharacterized protein n=1 Tax=Crucibulum laeve TaxID=68775 RepID=A0A5C3LSZ9_9AGAR|nr:hypothetical protein BDQ12DRAFT_726029 [Crucibulum laeve]